MSRWYPPPTWVSTDYVTGAQFNLLSRNLEFLKDRERVHCYNSQDEETKDQKWEVIRWDSDAIDNNSMHSNHRIKRNYNQPWSDAKHGSRDGIWPDSARPKAGRVNIHNGGAYMVVLKVNFEANTTGARKIQVRVNSTETLNGGRSLGIWTEDATSAGPASMFAKRVAILQRGDHLNAFAWQSSGGVLDISHGKAESFFQVFQLSG